MDYGLHVAVVVAAHSIKMDRDLVRLSTTCYDLLIVGGGIYGACAAWEAVLRGLSVALVEQGDFGGATSANSQKIVHGGLRYLQHADFKRMRQSIREREILMQIAPHLIHPLPCVLPTYRGSLHNRQLLRLALAVYDLMAADRNRGLVDPQKRIPRCRILSKAECLRLVPGISPEELTGGALWHDAQVYNSERLTLAFIRSATEAGAQVANYVRVTELLRQGTRVVGARAQDVLTAQPLDIQARLVLNTSGPWVDRLLAGLNGSGQRLLSSYLKAMNLVTRSLTDGVALGVSPRSNAAIHRGLLFVAPWRNRSIIGTAYAPFDGHPDDCRVTEEEIEEFLVQINRAYPVALSRDEVSFVHVGLVPAASRDFTKGIPHLETRYRLVDHQRRDGIDGLVSVVGVKYTTARDVAEKAVNVVLAKLGKPTPRPLRREAPLWGGRIEQFEAFLGEAIRQRLWGLGPTVIRHLVYSYGSAYQDVLRLLGENLAWGELVPGSSEVLKAEVVYALRHEMAVKLSDVVFRRTDLGTLGHPGLQALHSCANLMADELDWNAARLFREVEDTEAVFARMGARRMPEGHVTTEPSYVEELG